MKSAGVVGLFWPPITALAAGIACHIAGPTNDEYLMTMFAVPVVGLFSYAFIAYALYRRMPCRWSDEWRTVAALALTAPIVSVAVYVGFLVFIVVTYVPFVMRFE